MNKIMKILSYIFTALYVLTFICAAVVIVDYVNKRKDLNLLDSRLDDIEQILFRD